MYIYIYVCVYICTYCVDASFTQGKHWKTGSDFQNRTPISQEIRARTGPWDFIISKYFCMTKATIIRVKKHFVGLPHVPKNLVLET
jgi:hypothetical protein